MAKKFKALTKQISRITSRLDAIESRLDKGAGCGPGPSKPPATSKHMRYCAMPHVPQRTLDPDVSDARARAIRYIEKKWVNGTTLHYYFFTSGDDAGAKKQKKLVRQAFDVWKNVGIGLKFEEVDEITDAEVRIGFRRGDGAWSYVGRDVIDIPGQHERTMNFGWDLTRDSRGLDTPVHEIGHTLGYPHEHQNPFSGIVWDEQAVIDYFGGPPNNWSEASTRHNVLRKLSKAAVEGTEWDPDSVMHYGFPSGLIKVPERYRAGLTPEPGLSRQDKKEARVFYPPLDDARNNALAVFSPAMLSLQPAGQKNFTISPVETRQYTIQTFGKSDTVMVLFEETATGHTYLAGDDDSGSSRNASITRWLDKSKTYTLRIRLYLNYASGNTAVMLW